MAHQILLTSALWTGLFYLLLLALLYIFVILSKKLTLTHRARKNPHYANIPSSPRHWLWGNLINDGPCLSPSLNRHPDYGMQEIWEKLDRPPAFLIDLWPIDFGILVIADPTVAEALVQPSPEFKFSVPKSDTTEHLWPLIGRESLITAQGETWRALRRRFNKGFSPQHLHSLSPLIISKIRIFTSRLEQRARTQSIFVLKDLAQDLTTDVITELAMSTGFHAQSTPEGEGEKSWPFGILTASHLLSSLTFPSGQGFHLGIIDPVRPIRSWFYEKVINWKLYRLISDQAQTEIGGNSKTSRSIVSLAVAGLTPSSELIWNTVAQVKSFLFAGQDTTATLLQWCAYEMSKSSHSPHHASVRDQLCAEHDAALGKGRLSVLDVLSDPHESEIILGDKLPYTTAFVKEVLRLHPPAGTARQVLDVSKTSPEFKVDIAGKDVAVNGLRIYPCQWLIHRNKKVWGDDAEVFRPERWLDREYMDRLPAGSWRPFERGPRNCIGQTLAMMEGVIGVCVMARGFDFTKEGLDGRNGEKEVWNVHRVTSVPVDGMKMSVKVRVAAG